MNEHEKWLANRITTTPISDEGEKKCIDSLTKKNISDAELWSSIDVLEVLLSPDALPALLSFIKAEERNILLRRRAAKAISVIGSSYIETELRTLLSSPSSELRLLAEVALGTRSLP